MHTLVLRALGRASRGLGLGGRLLSRGLTSTSKALHWPQHAPAQQGPWNLGHQGN